MSTTGAFNVTNFLVQVNGTSILMSKSCKLDFSHAARDTTTKDDAGWKTALEGMRNWKVDVDGLVSFSSAYNFDELFSLMSARTVVQVRFMSATVSGDYWYHGSAIITALNADAPDQTSTSFTASFEGTGILTQVAHT